MDGCMGLQRKFENKFFSTITADIIFFFDVFGNDVSLSTFPSGQALPTQLTLKRFIFGQWGKCLVGNKLGLGNSSVCSTLSGAKGIASSVNASGYLLRHLWVINIL